MKIETRKDGGRLIVAVGGRMDAVAAPEFDRRSDEWLAEGASAVVLDFAALEYISSAGLRSLLLLGKKISARQGQIVISGIKDVVKEVFVISGFGSIFAVAESVDAALGRM
jgi:anti-anti-sigma factor